MEFIVDFYCPWCKKILDNFVLKSADVFFNRNTLGNFRDVSAKTTSPFFKSHLWLTFSVLKNLVTFILLFILLLKVDYSVFTKYFYFFQDHCTCCSFLAVFEEHRNSFPWLLKGKRNAYYQISFV